MAKRSQQKKDGGNGISAQGAVAPPWPAWSTSGWCLGLVLVLAVVLIYQPVWYAGFIWDDDDHVTANPCVVGPLGVKEIWTTSLANFFPLTLTTFWAEHALWGLWPLPYHLVNVLQHAACAVLLWRVLKLLRVPGAWLGAALWAVHPVEVESVAWVSEMKNTESSLFFLLSVLFFVRWLRARESGGGTGSNWNYALTLLFAALAMTAKSSTMILPVVLCLCAWWVEGRWPWRTLAWTAPVFLMSVAAGVLGSWVESLQLTVAPDPQWARSWPERLAGAGDAVWFYLGKLLWPHPLITIYPRWQIDAGAWFAYLPLLGVIAMLLVLWLKRTSWGRPWFFAFAYFLATLLPALGLIDNTIFQYSLVFDHFQYLASMGPLALAGAGIVRLAGFALPGKTAAQATLGAVVLLILGLLSWQRAWAYENQETLWTDALAKNPDCWAGHNNLGFALYQKGDLAGAAAQFQAALELNPNDAEAYSNLGNVFMQGGRPDAAIAEYQKTLELKPGYAQAQNNLGGAYFQKGEVDEALAHFQQAVEINPNLPDAHNNLGVALAKIGRLDDAMAEYQKALAILPDYARAHTNLGDVLLRQGRVDDAVAQYQEVVRLNPSDAGALNNLARAQARQQAAPVKK